MNFIIKDLVHPKNTRLVGDKILITDFYPEVRQARDGILIPRINGRIPIMFELTVRRCKRHLSKDNFISCPTPQLVVPKEVFEEQLDKVIKGMRKAFPKADITTINVDRMYVEYVETMNFNGISGVISIVKSNDYNPVEVIDYAPCEGTVLGLGYHTFLASVARIMPSLNMDFRTSRMLFQKYLDKCNMDVGSVSENKALFGASREKLVSFISKTSSGLSHDEVYNMIQNTSVNSPGINKYISAVCSVLKIREAQAQGLILYRKDLIGAHMSKTYERNQLSHQRINVLVGAQNIKALNLQASFTSDMF